MPLVGNLDEVINKDYGGKSNARLFEPDEW